MNVLVINCGSSSLKFKLIDMNTKNVKASGLVERIGQKIGKIKATTTEKYEEEFPIPDHKVALEKVVEVLQDKKTGVIKDVNEIDAVGHRVLHGGMEFSQSVEITPVVLDTIRKCIPLAPLHNPGNILGIEVASKIFPKARHVAVFDTAFHQTMPPRAYRYAIPTRFFKEDNIRRYGAHGTSHLYVTKEAAKLLNKPLDQVNLITVHIGNGASITAVKNGKSIDTTMGLTPLAGVVMGTRCGDIDPAIPCYLCKNKNIPIDEVYRILNKESGMYGLTGYSDLRDIEDKYMEGDKVCSEAMDIYTYTIKKAIGAYFAALNGVDGIVFTAGVGENSNIVRRLVCKDMDIFGIKLNDAENDVRRKEARIISDDASKVKIMVIPTNEELEIANQTVEVLSRNNK